MAVMIRMLSDTYPAPQLSALRNFFGLAPALLILMTNRAWVERGRPWRLRHWKIAILRGLLVTGAQLCFYLALTRLTFPTVATLAYASPLFVTALSMPLLGDRVGPWRWGAVLIGFAGVLMVMRPGSDVFTMAALLPVGAALGYASSSVLVRLVDTDAPTPLINIYAAGGALVFSGLIALTVTDLVMIQSWEDAGLIALMGCCGGCGVLCLMTAYRSALPSVLAPFEFAGILIAFVLGWIFFNELPLNTVPGVFFIVGGGLLIVWREHYAKRAV